MTQNTKQQNRVRWFNARKGFGFIEDPDGDDVFVHYRSIEPGVQGYKSLEDGELVEYIKIKSDRGWMAAEVRRIDHTKPADSSEFTGFSAEHKSALLRLLTQLNFDTIHPYASSDEEAELMTDAIEQLEQVISAHTELPQAHR